VSVLTEGHAPSQLRDSGGLGESLTALSSCYHPRVGGSAKTSLLYCLPFTGRLPEVIALPQQLRAPLLNSVESWVGGAWHSPVSDHVGTTTVSSAVMA